MLRIQLTVPRFSATLNPFGLKRSACNTFEFVSNMGSQPTSQSGRRLLELPRFLRDLDVHRSFLPERSEASIMTKITGVQNLTDFTTLFHPDQPEHPDKTSHMDTYKMFPVFSLCMKIGKIVPLVV